MYSTCIVDQHGFRVTVGGSLLVVVVVVEYETFLSLSSELVN